MFYLKGLAEGAGSGAGTRGAGELLEALLRFAKLLDDCLEGADNLVLLNLGLGEA